MKSFKELQEVIAADIRKKIISDGIVYEILVDTIMLSKWVGIRKKTASHIKAIEVEKNVYMMEYQKREKDYNNAGMNNTDLKTWKKLISTKQIKKVSSSFMEAKKKSVKKTNIKELEKALKNHDWFYMYSDDSRAYNKGRDESDKIHKLIKDIGDEGKKLYKKYSKK